MKKMLLPLLALCALPAFAQTQSVSLVYTQLTPRDLTFSGVRVMADKSSGIGLRYAVDLGKVSDVRISLEATWLPRTRARDIKADGTVMSKLLNNLRHEYMGLGVSTTWTKIVDFGFCLDVRHESSAVELLTRELGSDLTRPWLSARVGYTLDLGKMKPFVALEYGLPLAKKINENPNLVPFSIPQNMNPKSQLSFNLGVRF